ncbi:hypothetical protein SASPL_101026 [Salvia splendens]|uniref:Uncharacterized protein n=1 Tax=Salvia splendens TaxID=180675 RepID=A0A8X9AAU7_SALSN|nr:hypothetical protein SASPL_101026 [Salvia splendens]
MALSLLRELNGERAVVFLYIVRILLSIPLSLVPEGFSLSFLSLPALCVEISADDASTPLSIFFRTRIMHRAKLKIKLSQNCLFLKSDKLFCAYFGVSKCVMNFTLVDLEMAGDRPGVSSGVLLGAVTLPGLLISKLVQTLRANSLQEVRVEEFEYLKSQCWAASSSCFAVLIFLSLVGQCPGKSKSSICSPSRKNQIYSSICVIFFVGSGLASLSGKLYVGK